MGIEYWILKCPKFISHMKKIEKFSVEVRLFEIKFKNKNPKFRNIYEVQFKNRASLSSSFFFLQGYSEMKMKIKE